MSSLGIKNILPYLLYFKNPNMTPLFIAILLFKVLFYNVNQQVYSSSSLTYLHPNNKWKKKMSNPSFLDFQYNLSKRNFLRKPTRMFTRERQNSRSLPVYQPSLDDLKKVFNRFDANKDGKISPEEYKAILKATGKKNLVTREVQKIFDVADADGDGYIDFKEFVEVQKKEGGVKTMDLQGAFHTFDKDGDGKISVQEVYELQKGLGQRCTLQDCRKMVKAVDANGDGVIDLDEFVTMMTRTMTLC